MKTLSKHIPARELPGPWREEGQFAPDERVTVTIEVEDPALATLRREIDEAIVESERGGSRPFDEAAVERINENGRRRLAAHQSPL